MCAYRTHPFSAIRMHTFYVLYMKKLCTVRYGITCEYEEKSMQLLYLLPDAKLHEEGEVLSANAISFGAETLSRQLEHIFNYYHDNVHDWAVRQVADICSLNKSITNRMGIPHV